ncbi:MAG: DegT/DnrJ/EryC1/StrS family aminotransferase [Armatimonadetes bacterium]|nr:DegT/DnrJ/EryC1/StrS family aminotransferase [Armatimonadota bacterium]
MSKLAIDGGEPVRTDPWPARIQIDDREIDAVMQLMNAARDGGAFDRYGGTEVDTYEQEFAEYMGTKFATACSAGTASIHAALGALRLEPGSEVICAPVTDQGAIMPVVDLNCIPVFADASPECMNMSPEGVRAKITERTRAIVCGHIAGIPCEMDEIMAIAEEHDLWVIEDCAQAHDAVYDGKKVGSIGHMGCFSLMSGKHTTAGGQGGMVVTDDEELYWNAKRFADRGKPFNSEVGSNLFLGLNYRMTELEACVGRVQLQKMAGITDARRAFMRRLEEEIADLETVKVCWYPEKSEPAWWFGLIRIYTEKLTVDKTTFAAAVAAEGIPLSAGYGAIATHAHWLREQSAFGRESHFPWDTLWDGDWEWAMSVPNAEAADANHMRITVHECLTEREAIDTAAALRKVEEAYRK